MTQTVRLLQALTSSSASLDRQPAAGLGRLREVVGRERGPRLVDELAARGLVGVDDDDSLLLREHLGRSGDLRGLLGRSVDRLRGCEPDEREPDAAHARDVGVCLHGLEEVAAGERGVPGGEVVQAISERIRASSPRSPTRLERSERLSVELERLARSPRWPRAREPAERHAGSFPVAEPLLDLERVREALGARSASPADRVEHASKVAPNARPTRSRLRGSARSLSAARRDPSAGRAHQREGAAKRRDAELALRADLLGDLDMPRPTRSRRARSRPPSRSRGRR